MDEQKKEYTLDDLEDIIREYSTHRPQKREAEREMEQTRPIEPQKAQAGDTRPMPPLKNQSTQPLPETDVRIYSQKSRQEKTEPYTSQWEPEYDSPMGEYKEPIEFPQNPSRLLQQKLERGPQRQYEKLNTATLGKLRAGMLLNLILFLAAAGTALLYTRVGEQRLKWMIGGQLVVMLLSALVGYRQLLDGVNQMFHRRFRLNSLLAVTLAVCWTDGLICIKNHQLPFAAVFSLQMLMAQWAEYQHLQTQLSQLDTLRNAAELTAVVKQEDYYRHQCAYRTRSGQPEDFMDNYRTVSGPERLLCRYALTVVAVGGVLALICAIACDLGTGIRVYAAALLAAMPASAFVCIRRPLAVLEKRMQKLGTVICGWKGVQAVEKQGYYPLTHADLFPGNHVKLNGVRFYGERNPNTVVSYVAALMNADGGSLAKPFEQLRASRNARVCKVTELMSYPGGVGGQIDGLSVIAGTLEFMEDMGVDVADVSHIPHAVYAAVNQSLCAVFAVNFTRSKSSASGLRTLCDSRYVRPILVDCDFAITESFLEEKLGVPARRMQFPDCMTRTQLAQKQTEASGSVIALTTRKGLAQRAFAVTGSGALRAAWRFGVLIHILGGSIGFCAVTVLALKGAMALLTPYNLFLYGCLWMIPGMLVSEWTRNI